MSAKEQRKQQAIYLSVVLAIIFISIGSGLYFSGIGFGGFDENLAGEDVVGERFATLTDAQVICEQRVRKVFGERIRSLVVDTYSTRLDKKAGLFRVFIEAELYSSESGQGATVRHFINCFTRIDRVAIASFQFAKDGEDMQDPGSSIFGF